jgi:ornithine carbamoyltransferase
MRGRRPCGDSGRCPRAQAGARNWPKGRVDADAPLAGHVLAMIFEKNSTRTRVSFDMAMRQLGGSAIVMDAGGMQLGRGEIADTARVLSRMVDAIMIRTNDHAKIEELAAYASVPVINGLPMPRTVPDHGRSAGAGGTRHRAGRAWRWPGWAMATMCCIR